ncbi:hypothetical protein [Phytohabitans rumicis]|uniref:hypothetical protein n=1 Tax=Phytohabitans rumicis TaxID=1076125 RepID=UPI0031E919CD
MRTSIKLGGYALGLVAVFGAALGVGNLVGDPAPVAGGAAPAHPAPAVGVPGGLQVSQDGYRLVPASRELATGAPAQFAFRVLGPDGQPVTRYTATHEKDLHLIVVRRDLSGFQHVHPTLAADGTWSIPLRAGAPGQYRVFADFQPAGRDSGLTLGVDVPAAGLYRPVAVPAPAPVAAVDGYQVTLAGALVPGTSSKLTLTVTRAGQPVTDLQPYLGAYGHLVALRDGDLAYLHVHPDEASTDPGPAITFYAEVPSTGTYRLYLDFKHGDTVRTAEFTAAAGTGAAAAAPAATPTPDHGHD